MIVMSRVGRGQRELLTVCVGNVELASSMLSDPLTEDGSSETEPASSRNPQSSTQGGCEAGCDQDWDYGLLD